MKRILTGLLLLLAGCTLKGSPVLAGPGRISGPYTHANLSIFLVHGAGRPSPRPVLTLQEALAQKKAVVYETGDVNELAVECLSDTPVFIQAGDIVKGGRQDRMLGHDLLVTRGMGRLPITSFCVEQSRWSARGGSPGVSFDCSENACNAKEIRLAVQAGDQQEVWRDVADLQGKISMNADLDACAEASPSSLQLTAEKEEVKEGCENYTKPLADLLERNPDAVGFGFAVNGKLDSVEVYESPELCRKLWGKYLEACALEALAAPKGVEAKADAEQVRQALQEADAVKGEARDLPGGLKQIRGEGKGVVVIESRDAEGCLHRSVLTK